MSKRQLLAAAALVAAYWWFAGTFSANEAVVMLLSLAAAQALVVLIIRCGERSFVFRAPSLNLLRRTSTSLLTDTFKVGRFLLQSLLRRSLRSRRSISRQPFHFGAGAPQETARRALVVLSISASPDSFVIDLEENGTLVEHSLVGGPRPTDPKWSI